MEDGKSKLGRARCVLSSTHKAWKSSLSADAGEGRVSPAAAGETSQAAGAAATELAAAVPWASWRQPACSVCGQA